MKKVITSVSQWTVAIGAAVFVGVLFLSAYWEADIRWLLFFQAWVYLATIILVWKDSRWGYFIGVGAAALWNYTTLFVNTFLENGLDQASILVHTGHLPRPDLLISVPAWLSNLAIIAGGVLGYGWMADKKRSDILKFTLAVAGTTGFFALIVALLQPRYLGLFRGLLHPHLHL
jgi:hypothetical protein